MCEFENRQAADKRAGNKRDSDVYRTYITFEYILEVPKI